MNKRPKIEYPCEWRYKIIGAQLEDLQEAVKEIIPAGDYTLEHSNTSSKGNYLCMNLEVTVYDHATREGLYRALCAHESIRMVL